MNEKKKSPSQIRRDKLRITKFNLKKGTTVNEEASGNPEESEHSKVLEEIDDVTNSEVHYVTGEWVNAPEDSRSFNKLFKPIYEGVEKMVNFQEGIPTEAEKKEKVTPFLVTFKMKTGIKTNFLTNLKNWPDGIRNVRINLRANLK